MAHSGSREGVALACVLADDHQGLLASLADLLHHEGFAVVGTATTGADAIQLIKIVRPDVAVLDFRFPDMTGLEVAREASRLGLTTAIVIHTAVAGPGLVRDALKAGVLGIAVKAVPPESLLRAVAAAVAGEIYIDPSLECPLPGSRESSLAAS